MDHSLDGTNGSSTLLLAPESPSLDLILEAIRRVEEQTFKALVIPFDMIREPSPLPTALRIGGDALIAEAKLRGLHIHVSNLLDGLKFPVRVHRKRKWMSESYHRRIQKKWNKRFGMGPAAFFMQNGVLKGALTNFKP